MENEEGCVFQIGWSSSVWTANGRKRIRYAIPSYFQQFWQRKPEVNGITIKQKNGKLMGYVSVTLPDSLLQPIYTAIALIGTNRFARRS